MKMAYIMPVWHKELEDTIEIPVPPSLAEGFVGCEYVKWEMMPDHTYRVSVFDRVDFPT